MIMEQVEEYESKLELKNKEKDMNNNKLWRNRLRNML